MTRDRGPMPLLGAAVRAASRLYTRAPMSRLGGRPGDAPRGVSVSQMVYSPFSAERASRERFGIKRIASNMMLAPGPTEIAHAYERVGERYG
jgi:hypothetical protein